MDAMMNFLVTPGIGRSWNRSEAVEPFDGLRAGCWNDWSVWCVVNEEAQKNDFASFAKAAEWFRVASYRLLKKLSLLCKAETCRLARWPLPL